MKFKNKKNHNYQKFSNHLTNIMRNDGLGFRESFEIFIKITRHFQVDYNVVGGQPMSILKGFTGYWENLKQLSFEQMEDSIIQYLIQFPYILWKPIIGYLLTKSDFKMSLKQKMRNIIDQLSKQWRNKQNSLKILLIINIFSLCHEYKQFILDLLIFNKFKDIDFFFKDNFLKDNQYKYMIDQNWLSQIKNQQSDNQIKKFLIIQYIKICVKQNNLQDAQKAVKSANIDPYSIPPLIKAEQLKFLNYQYRNFPLYFIELIVINTKQYILHLIEILVRNNRIKQALYFSSKYSIMSPSLRNQHNQNVKMVNILLENDNFGATQLRVLGEPNDYLELQDFELREENVYFIDQNNYQREIFEKLLSSEKVGIDCQKTGGRHTFQAHQISIAQFGTLDTIFIFDILNLRKSQIFSTDLKRFYNKYQGSIIGQDIKKDLQELSNSMSFKPQQSTLKNLRLFDTMKIFQTEYPNQKKSSLEHICKFLYKKKMSKYQQCSEWSNRPLRKAQLHYAAFDAYLPIKIFQMLRSKK